MINKRKDEKMKAQVVMRQNVKYKLWNTKLNSKGKRVKTTLAEEGESHNTDCKLHGVLVADHMAGGADTLISYGHAGTGLGQTAQDTNLDAHVDEVRTAIDSKTQGAGDDANDVVYIFTLGAGVCTATLTEVGLFIAQAQATADMQFYDDSLSVVKGATQILEVTWTVTYGTSPP